MKVVHPGEQMPSPLNLVESGTFRGVPFATYSYTDANFPIVAFLDSKDDVYYVVWDKSDVVAASLLAIYADGPVLRRYPDGGDDAMPPEAS